MAFPSKRQQICLASAMWYFFSPEDLEIIERGPDARRHFIDMELCQLDPMYLFHLTKYKQVLRQRNELLKQIGLNKDLLDTLDIWNSELVKYGNYVISARKSFIDKLNDYIQEIHKNLTGQRETITLRYEPSVREDEFATQIVMSEQKICLPERPTSGRTAMIFLSCQKGLTFVNMDQEDKRGRRLCR